MDEKKTELQTMYEKLEGNYDTVLRLLKNEFLIKSLLDDFLEYDGFSNLERSMEAGDDEAAFEAVHALKGVALNLEFGFFSKSLIDLTEALRHGRKPDTEELYLAVKRDYWKTIRIIKGEEDNR